MKKNNYIIFVIVTLFLLTLAFELQDVQVAGIRFGNSRLSDTTGYIATNRPFKVNGNELVTGNSTITGQLDVTGTSSLGNTDIQGDLNQADGISTLDTLFVNNDLTTSGYTQLGGSSPLIKMKLIKFLSGTAGGASVTSSHGITDWHSIIQWEANIKDEANNVIVNPNSYFTTNQFYAYVDSLNCVVVVPAGGTNLATDTTTFIIWYKY